MGYFLRVYSKRPVHTLAIILILGCGIAVTTFTFTLFDSILLEPLPYPESERIVRLYANVPPPTSDVFISTPTFDDIDQQSTIFDSLCSIWGGTVNMTIGDNVIMTHELMVTKDFFEVYNLYPIDGPVFQEDGQEGIILTHHLWMKEFGGDKEIIGKSVNLNGVATPIIGIMPKGLRRFYPFQVDYISSLDLHTDYLDGLGGFWQKRNVRLICALGRIRQDITLEKAQVEMDVIASRLQLETNAEMKNVAVRLVPLIKEVTETISHTLKFAMAGAIVLFLIVLLLVGNLLLSGWIIRTKEFGTRLALGASRTRLVKQLISESLLLSVFGGLLGLGMSVLMTSLFRYWAPDRGYWVPIGISRLEELVTSETVLLFWLIAIILGGFLPGLIAAITCSRVEPYSIMKDSAGIGGTILVGRRFTTLITALSVSLSCLLLTLTGLLGFSYIDIETNELGYEPNGVITGNVNLTLDRYKNKAEITRFHSEFIRRIQNLPGIQSAGSIIAINLLNKPYRFEYRLEESKDEDGTPGKLLTISSDSLEVLGLKFKSGRTFIPSDLERPDQVVIIDETLARRHWPEGNAVNNKIFFYNNYAEIIGVVSSIRSGGYDGEIVPTIYRSFGSNPNNFFGIAVKSSLPVEQITKLLQEAARQTDPNIAVYDICTLGKRLYDQSSLRRISAQTILLLGLIGALISCIGIYAVILFDVSNRIQEIGIRAALGASTFNIYQHFLKKGLALILVGIALGLGSTYFLIPLISRSIFKLPAMTTGVQLFTAVAVLILGIISCLLAIRRSLDLEKIYACLKQE